MADDNIIDVGEGNEISLHCPARLSFFRDCFRSCKTSRIPCIGILRHMSVDIFGAAINPHDDDLLSSLSQGQQK